MQISFLCLMVLFGYQNWWRLWDVLAIKFPWARGDLEAGCASIKMQEDKVKKMAVHSNKGGMSLSLLHWWTEWAQQRKQYSREPTWPHCAIRMLGGVLLYWKERGYFGSSLQSAPQSKILVAEIGNICISLSTCSTLTFDPALLLHIFPWQYQAWNNV